MKKFIIANALAALIGTLIGASIAHAGTEAPSTPTLNYGSCYCEYFDMNTGQCINYSQGCYN